MRVQMPRKCLGVCKQAPRAFSASRRHVRVRAASGEDMTPEQQAELEEKMKDPAVRD